jgi:phosphate acetyltransferase
VGQLAAGGLVQPVVVGGPAGVSWPAEVDCVALDDPHWAPLVQETWARRQQTRAESGARGADPRQDPLLFMAIGVGLGLADAGVAGAVSTSASVIRAGLRGLGLAAASDQACGAFVVALGDSLWTWADCTVTPDPTTKELASIGYEAASWHRRVSGVQAKVALLSYSTAGSAVHPLADKMREALAILRKDHPDLDADGEMQFDAAVDPEIGARKFPGSPVAGQANVFVFPDLNAANIAYKVVQRAGRARVMGSFVLGLTRPWVDLSRGCSTEEIVRTALVLCGPQPAPVGPARRIPMSFS